MIKHFWRAMTALGVLVTAITILSWFYLKTAHIPLLAPNRYSTWTNFPTTIPTLWNVIRPAPTAGWYVTLLVLFGQIFLTGGFYGTLIRANTGHFASFSTFLSDSLRPFGRLIVWNVLWAAIFLLIADVSRVSGGLALFVMILALIVRFIFIFAETALVAEGDIRMATALRRAGITLMSVLVPMIPFGILILILSGFTALLIVALPGLGVWIGVAYSLAMTWLLHMIVARYLAYSNYHANAD